MDDLTKNVTELLRASKQEDPAAIDKWERRAKMSIRDQLKEIAQDGSMYKDSKLQQHFSAIKSIKAIKGQILVEVDEENSKQAAIKTAFEVLGPKASPEEFKKYVGNHTNKTTLFSLKTFIRNIKNLVLMATQFPEYFGEGTGGGEIKDLLDSAKGAIKDAREYLKQHRYSLPPDVYTLLTQSDFHTDEKKDFSKYLGEGWEKAALEQDRIEAAKKLTKLVTL